ncbi:helix-turn-helix domain-containing protein [Mesorhizobium sp. CA14]|uniref:helix-turn-helix transcriptional regulator n=1 Tax=Mesorhizobium sp. CA14 TaxID=2876642 RepID=UPI001CCD392F|nr:helix-turn-helix domain-containing protein [Mesorhizobium sp. CA14]MBZ9850300.1 helix-turn-helix domain-containing protein [Mesorhizobium sp. CA14]
MDGRSRIAWNLRRVRAAKGISQESLALEAEVDRGTISEIESLKFNPSIDLLDRLAAALAVDVAELLLLPSPGSERPKPLSAGRKPGR